MWFKPTVLWKLHPATAHFFIKWLWPLSFFPDTISCQHRNIHVMKRYGFFSKKNLLLMHRTTASTQRKFIKNYSLETRLKTKLTNVPGFFFSVFVENKADDDDWERNDIQVYRRDVQGIFLSSISFHACLYVTHWAAYQEIYLMFWEWQITATSFW